MEKYYIYVDECIINSSYLFYIIDVHEGTYRKVRVAIKVLKEATSAALFRHEADIMRYVFVLIY